MSHHAQEPTSETRDQDNPRGFYKLASVQSLITGYNGTVRGATLRVGSKSGSLTFLQQPSQQIYPLEIHSDPSTITTTDLQRTRTSDESHNSTISRGATDQWSTGERMLRTKLNDN